MQAELRDGWLMVPYSGPELTLVEIGLGAAWYPAYLDYHPGTRQRVAMIRPPVPLPPAVQVRVRAAGTEYT